MENDASMTTLEAAQANVRAAILAQVANINQQLKTDYLLKFDNWSISVLAGRIPNTNPPQPPFAYTVMDVPEFAQPEILWAAPVEGISPVCAIPPIPSIPSKVQTVLPEPAFIRNVPVGDTLPIGAIVTAPDGAKWQKQAIPGPFGMAFFYLRLAILLLCCSVVLKSQPAPVLNIAADSSTVPGGQASFSLALSSAHQAAALQFSVVLPAGLVGGTATISPAAAAASKSLTCTPFTPIATGESVLVCVMAGDVNVIPAGLIGKITALVLPTVRKDLVVSVSSIVAAAGDATGTPLVAGLSASLGVRGSPCDVTGDWVTDITDFTATVSQVLLSVIDAMKGKPLVSCTTGDVNRNGTCDALDVQMVAVAIKTGICQ